MQTQTERTLKPITNGLLWIFAVGQFGWSLLSGIISTWLVHLYTGNVESGWTNGIFSSLITQTPLIASITLFGIITAVGRVFDAVTDPLIASWSDRADFRGGRRIPFMKVIAIPFAFITAGVFFIPTTSSIALNNTLIFILLMLFYLLMTLYCTPYNALIAELGDTQEHRINVSTYISFTYIAGFSVATFMPNLAGMLKGVAGSDEGGIRLAIGVLSAVAAIAMILPAFLIKERDYINSKPVRTPAFKSLAATFKNSSFRRFMYSDVIYFFAVTLFQTGLADFETNLMGIGSDKTFLLTVLMTVVSLSLYPVVNKLAPKTGKKKMIIVGFFVYAFVFLITAVSSGATLGTVHIFGIIVAVLAGIPMAILGILPQACVADVSELSTLETGEDRSGMFFAARTFAMKLGQAIAMLVYTSVTAARLVNGAETVTTGQYRTAAFIATGTCLAGALLFFLYKEKDVLSRIRELRSAGKRD
ncbi:MAG: MFS transporter [Clostridia bacterium]|nr:MFS transporter [Clostridia bacterium]MBP5269558.1 MFS transporter [Clostridia bacterium]